MSRAHRARQGAKQPVPASTSHGEVATTTPTADDNFTAPGTPEEPAPVAEFDRYELQRLEDYLKDRFPTEVGRTNRQRPETPVDTALRLLEGLHAHVPPTQVQRCQEAYCNKPQGHRDSHGWVHFG